MAQSYKKLYWTLHSQLKMKQYRLSKQKLLSILYNPERRERGIVPNTIAVMRTNKKKKEESYFLKKKRKIKKPPGEIWLMYQDTKDLRKIISAWRYPGVSQPGQEIPIPEDIKQAILNNEIE